jgi:hypothetical protein
MSLKISVLSIVACLFLLTACEKKEETVFTTDGRKVSYDLDTRRGETKDVGEVGIEGIDIYGWVSSSTGGETGNALVTCERAGKYGYLVTKQPQGACSLDKAVLYETDSTSYYYSGETIIDLSQGEVYYDENVEAGTKRIIYMSQGPYTDYEYEVRVRFIEE